MEKQKNKEKCNKYAVKTNIISEQLINKSEEKWCNIPQ